MAGTKPSWKRGYCISAMDGENSLFYMQHAKCYLCLIKKKLLNATQAGLFKAGSKPGTGILPGKWNN